MALLHSEHPCRPVAHVAAANTVPGDVIRGARYREQGRVQEYKAIQVWPVIGTDWIG